MRLLILSLILLVLCGCNTRLEPPEMKYVMIQGMEYAAMIPASVLESIIKSQFNPNNSEEKTFDWILYDMLFPEKKKNVIIIIEDTLYGFLDIEWFSEEFMPYYGKVLEQENITYSPKFDCDDFTKFFMYVLQKCHADSTENFSVAESPLVAEIHYVDDVERRIHHSISMLILYKNDSLILLFFEPQTNKFVILTPKQIESIYYINF